MVTYLSPLEGWTPAMAIEGPLSSVYGRLKSTLSEVIDYQTFYLFDGHQSCRHPGSVTNALMCSYDVQRFANVITFEAHPHIEHA